VRDIYEVLREKEDDIERVRREVEALRSVTPLLVDETDARSKPPAGSAVRMERRAQTVSHLREALLQQLRFLLTRQTKLSPRSAFG